MGTNGLFLLSENLVGEGRTGELKFGRNNKWQESKVRQWCRDFAGIEGDSVTDAFTAAELAAIQETFKSDGEYITPTEKVIIDGAEMTLRGATFTAAENILSGDKVFLLSVEEAKKRTLRLHIRRCGKSNIQRRRGVRVASFPGGRRLCGSGGFSRVYISAADGFCICGASGLQSGCGSRAFCFPPQLGASRMASAQWGNMPGTSGS